MSNYVEKSNIISALKRFHENDLNLFATKDEVHAEASARETADRILDARVTNLEQTTKQQEVTVSYPDDGTYSSIMPDGIPASVAKYAEVPTIKGKTRAWNQLVNTDTTEVILINGHVYFTVISGVFSVVTGTGASVSVTGGTDIVRDLTLIMPEFTPTGVNATDVATVLKALPDLANVDAYNAGSLVDTTVTGVETIGFNIWPEDWEVGSIDNSTGNPVVDNNNIRAKTFIPCMPSTTYFVKCMDNTHYIRYYWYDSNKMFIGGNITNSASGNTIESPSNACFIKIRTTGIYGNTYKNDICLNRSQSNTSISPHNGDYLPYQRKTLMLSAPFTGKSAGSVKEVLDIRTGKKTRPVGSIDLGTLNWNYSSSYSAFTSSGISSQTVEGSSTNLLCSKYQFMGHGISALIDHEMRLDSFKTLYIRDDAYNGDATTFKTAMSGVYLYYQLATPLSDEQVCDPIPDNYLEVQGGGTIRTIQSQSPVIDNCLDVTYDLIPSA